MVVDRKIHDYVVKKLSAGDEWMNVCTKPALGEGPRGPWPPRFVRNNKNNDNNNRVIIEGEKMPKNFENDKAFPCYWLSAFCNCKTVWNFTAIFCTRVSYQTQRWGN